MFRTIKLIKHLEPLFLFRFQLTFGHTPFELLFYDKFLFVTKDLVQFMEKFLYWLNQAYLENTTGKERVSKKGNHAGLLGEYVQQASVNPFVAAA